MPEDRKRSKLSSRFASGISGLVGAVSGVAPHVLHHVGPLAGAAIFAGLGGTLLFGAVGLVVALPFLFHLYRRFGSILAPAVALAVFAAGFSLSTFLIGPAVQSALTAPAPATESMPRVEPAKLAPKDREAGDKSGKASGGAATEGDEENEQHEEHNH